MFVNSSKLESSSFPLKKVLDFICLRQLSFVHWQIGRARTRKLQCRLSLFFLALFGLTFLGSSYNIVFSISEFVIYPPAGEAQYLTFDSIADSINAKN